MKWLVGFVIVVAGGVSLYAVSVNRDRYVPPQEATSTPEAMSDFYSEHLGLQFNYSNIYEATTTQLKNGKDQWDVVTLVPRGYVAPENGDGPAAISLQAIPNPKNLSVENWIKKDSRSNWMLAEHDGGIGSTTVGGEPALAYKYSGLYNTSAVVVAHNDMIYFFTGEWNAPEDRLYADFQTLLQSVTFI